MAHLVDGVKTLTLYDYNLDLRWNWFVVDLINLIFVLERRPNIRRTKIWNDFARLW